MLAAHDLGMTRGEYVFYTIDFLPDRNVLDADEPWREGDGRDADAKKAFESVFNVRFSLVVFVLKKIWSVPLI